MTNPHLRHLTIGVTAALTLPLLLSSQSLAAKNDHRFVQSLEGIRMAHENYCTRVKEQLRLEEALASDLAGTDEGDEASATADKTFAEAKGAGCKWAL